SSSAAGDESTDTPSRSRAALGWRAVFGAAALTALAEASPAGNTESRSADTLSAISIWSLLFTEQHRKRLSDQRLESVLRPFRADRIDRTLGLDRLVAEVDE